MSGRFSPRSANTFGVSAKAPPPIRKRRGRAISAGIRKADAGCRVRSASIQLRLSASAARPNLVGKPPEEANERMGETARRRGAYPRGLAWWGEAPEGPSDARSTVVFAVDSDAFLKFYVNLLTLPVPVDF